MVTADIGVFPASDNRRAQYWIDISFGESKRNSVRLQQGPLAHLIPPLTPQLLTSQRLNLHLAIIAELYVNGNLGRGPVRVAATV